MHWPLLILAGYAVTVHVAVSVDRPSLGLAALALLVVTTVLPRLRTLAARSCAAIVIGGAALGLTVLGDAAASAIRLPPIILTGAMFAAFAGSLREGATPLVTMISLRMGATPSPALHRYTRNVTRAWSVFLLAILVECVLLAALAPADLWSLFTNVLNYAAIGAFFVVEYFVRRLSLPTQPHPGLIRFLRDLLRTDIRPNRQAAHDERH